MGHVPVTPPGTTVRHVPSTERWEVRDEAGTVLQSFDFSDVRMSVNWKAHCFADEAAQALYMYHAGTDNLSLESILQTIKADLTTRVGASIEELTPAVQLAELIVDTYCRYPSLDACLETRRGHPTASYHTLTQSGGAKL